MERHFRIFFWQKFVPLVALPIFGLLFVASPFTDGWSRTAWVVAGTLVGAAVAAYLLNAWRRSDVVLDDGGMTLHLAGGRETWPYAKLLKVRQIGKYRVRMCFDPDVADKHMHITLDMWSSDAFVDALLDGYAAATGNELAEPEEHAAAA